MNLPSIDPQVIALVIPVILLQLGLLIAAIVDLLRDDRAVRGGNKGLWAVVIVFVNLIGPILYFLVGRVDGVHQSQRTGFENRLVDGPVQRSFPAVAGVQADHDRAAAAG